MGLHFGVHSVSPKKGDFPFTPFVGIELTHCTKDNDGRVLLSPQLTTDGEVHYWIDRLIGELRKLREPAKRALRRNEYLETRLP